MTEAATEGTAQVRLPAFVGGETRLQKGSGVELLRPQDGSIRGLLVESGESGVDEAVADARRAYLENRHVASHQRAAWLQAGAAALREHAEAIAAAISTDIGKPIRAALFEARRGADLLEGCAAAALDIHGEVLPLDAVPAGRGLLGFTRRVPYGVVGGRNAVQRARQSCAPKGRPGNRRWQCDRRQAGSDGNTRRPAPRRGDDRGGAADRPVQRRHRRP